MRTNRPFPFHPVPLTSVLTVYSRDRWDGSYSRSFFRESTFLSVAGTPPSHLRRSTRLLAELNLTRCAQSPLTSDLSASTSYTIVVLTLSGLSYSPSSEEYFTTVAPSTVPTPPRDLIVHNITVTSAFISWAAPVSPGSTPITAYEVSLSYVLHPPSPAPRIPIRLSSCTVH
jgi:hypothetical protein